jgi:hypothetical protein
VEEFLVAIWLGLAKDWPKPVYDGFAELLQLNDDPNGVIGLDGGAKAADWWAVLVEKWATPILRCWKKLPLLLVEAENKGCGGGCR